MTYNNLVILGDSLSDAGKTNNTNPFLCRYLTDPLYNYTKNGIFVSDGEVWPIILARLLNVNLKDYALCGATSADILKNQTISYSNDFPTGKQDNNLVFLWGGNNDIGNAAIKDLLFDSSLVSSIESDVNQTIATLDNNSDPKLVVVMNSIDLGQLPGVANTIGLYNHERHWIIDTYPSYVGTILNWLDTSIIFKPLKYMINLVISSVVTKDSNDYNLKLSKDITSFSDDIVMLDIHKLFQSVLANPEKYDVVNPAMPCYYGVTLNDTSACAKAWHYDPKHVSNHGHKIIATYNCLALQNKSLIDGSVDCKGDLSPLAYTSLVDLAIGSVDTSPFHDEL